MDCLIQCQDDRDGPSERKVNAVGFKFCHIWWSEMNRDSCNTAVTLTHLEPEQSQDWFSELSYNLKSYSHRSGGVYLHPGFPILSTVSCKNLFFFSLFCFCCCCCFNSIIQSQPPRSGVILVLMLDKNLLIHRLVVKGRFGCVISYKIDQNVIRVVLYIEKEPRRTIDCLPNKVISKSIFLLDGIITAICNARVRLLYF